MVVALERGDLVGVRAGGERRVDGGPPEYDGGDRRSLGDDRD
jgi:hypothetical protein